jgi:hypothetical protein
VGVDECLDLLVHIFSLLSVSAGWLSVGVGITLDCKQQSQTCFQLPMKAYKTVCRVEDQVEN